MKILLLLLVCAAAINAQVKGCKTDYDKFRQVTTYHCAGALKTGALSYLTVTVSMVETGNAVFRVSTVESNLRFIRNREMFLLIDQTDRVTIAASDVDADVGYLGNLNQSLIFQVSRELLAKIANAKKVEVKIGSTEGSLDKGLLKKIQGIVALTKSPLPLLQSPK